MCLLVSVRRQWLCGSKWCMSRSGTSENWKGGDSDLDCVIVDSHKLPMQRGLVVL